MNLSLYSVIIINVVFLLALTLGKYLIFKKENRVHLAAKYSVFLATLFLFYFVGIFAVALNSLITGQYYELSLLLFVAAPFIIGKKATYEKINLYTNIQILTLMLSLFWSLALLYKNAIIHGYHICG